MGPVADKVKDRVNHRNLDKFSQISAWPYRHFHQ